MNEQSRCPLQVLIVEDSTDDALLIVDALRSDGFEAACKQISSEGEMRLALAQNAWDLIVADFRLPGFGGLEAFAIHREFNLDIPFIIVSGVISEEMAVSAMRAGVHDYISKSNLARLAPAVARELREADIRRKQKKAENALRTAHEELAAIHANAPVALLVVDEGLRLQKVNEMAAQFAGRPATEILGLRPGEAFGCLHQTEGSAGCGSGPSCLHCSLRAVALDTISNGARYSNVEKYLDVVRNGLSYRRCLLISTAPFRVDEQRKALICAQDITELKEAAAEIERQRDQLAQQAQLINLSQDAIITMDPSHKITGWNRGAIEMYGWTAEEARGCVIHKLLNSKNHMPISRIDEILSQEGRWDGELVHTTKDGQERIVESRHILLRDPAGKPLRILEINRDITARKRAERDLYSANQDLDQRVEELRTTVEQKNVLLREVQHRVKNNLQVISSLLSLEAARFPGGAHNALQESRDRVRSMALIHDKFCHSKDMSQIDFGDYINSLAQSFWDSYGSGLAGIELETDIDVRLAMDEAIPCGLIIQEFLSNSMKHAFRDGGGKIWIDFHYRAGQMDLQYRDNGVGLPATIDWRNPTSLGLQLISDLSYQLGGELSYRYSDGAVFQLEFPAENGSQRRGKSNSAANSGMR